MFLRTRHLFVHSLLPVLAAVALLLGLLWLLQSLRFLDLIINKGLGLGTFLQLTLLLLPQLLTVVLPLATLAGVAFALRRWQSQAETTAWLATGQHPWQLAAPVLLTGLLMTGLSFGVFWWLLPNATTHFKNLQMQVRQTQSQLLLEPGSFNQLSPHLMVYLQQRVGLTGLRQVLVHDTRTAEATTWYAQAGEIQLTPQGPLLQLSNGLRQQITPGQTAHNLLQFQSYTLSLSNPFGAQALPPRTPEREELTLAQLRTQAPTNAKIMAEWHRRYAWPLATLMLTVLAVGFLLRPHTRSSRPIRLQVALGVAGVLYLATLFGLTSLAEDGTQLALLGQWALPLAALGLAWLVRWRHLV